MEMVRAENQRLHIDLGNADRHLKSKIQLRTL